MTAQSIAKEAEPRTVKRVPESTHANIKFPFFSIFFFHNPHTPPPSLNCTHRNSKQYWKVIHAKSEPQKAEKIKAFAHQFPEIALKNK